MVDADAGIRLQVKSTLVVGALVDLLHSMLAGTRRKMLHGAATGNWGGRDASDTLAAEIMGNDTLRRELFPALVRAYASLDQVWHTTRLLSTRRPPPNTTSAPHYAVGGCCISPSSWRLAPFTG